MQSLPVRMLAALVLLLHAAAGKSTASRDGSKASPVPEVISLLNEMMAKGKEEKQAEEVQYAAYKQFCEFTSAAKKKDIKQATLDIESLEADIQQATTTAAKLDKEIQEHQLDAMTWGNDKTAASTVRTMEEADYAALHQDYSESIDALGRAIETLKAEDYSRPQADALVQLAALQNLRLVPAEAKQSLELFAKSVQAPEPPKAHGYEFQSGKIIDVLEGLLVKFRDELTAIEKHEMDTKSAYEKLMQDLTAEIASANQDVATKTEAHAAHMSIKAGKEGLLSTTSSTKASDESYLNDLVALCESKAADFDARQQLRSNELQAIQEAITILSSDTVSGTAEKHMATMLQAGNHSARMVLASLRATVSHDGGSNERKAAEFLFAQSQKLNSQALAHVASQLKDEDPLAEVKTMIQALIDRLKQEENEDANHEEWCNTELAANEQTRQEKTQEMERLAAHIDGLEAEIARFAGEIADLSQQLKDLVAAQAEATEERTKEKATNTQTIKDAQDGQEAVSKAVILLKEFYASAAGSTALLQKQQPEAPEIFDSPYKGMQDEGAGIIGTLEMIASDFAKLEADTSSAEEVAVEEYKKFMSDSEIDKTAKSKDVDYKTVQKQKEETALATAEADHESTRKELNLANDYYEKLKPSCVDEDRYDEYIAQKEAEIESLEEALAILEGQTAVPE